MFTKIFRKIFKRQLNKFSKHVICKAQEKNKINSEQFHYLAGIIDAELFNY
jgi:hypothetical protein